MQEAGDEASRDASTRALDWLKTKQLLDEPGDWRIRRPESGRRRLGVSIRE